MHAIHSISSCSGFGIGLAGLAVAAIAALAGLQRTDFGWPNEAPSRLAIVSAPMVQSKCFERFSGPQPFDFDSD